MKVITLLLDGLGDRSYAQLDYKTPLEYAETPTLDRISQESQCGLMTTLKEGVPLGTDLAHFILFGYALAEYPIRTMIDAVGEKVNYNKNDLLLRASFGEVEKEDGFLIKSRFTKDLEPDEVHTIIQSINRSIEGYSFELIHSYDSHCFVKIKGEQLSDQISDTDPFRRNVPVMAVEPFATNEKHAIKTADLINRFLVENYEILNGLEFNQKREAQGLEKANFILTKWAGKYKTVESFEQKNGMTGLMIGKSDLLSGIAQIIKMDYTHYETFEEAVQKALTADYDYIHLHTKKMDTASHKKDPMKKVEAIEKIDQLISPLLNFEGLLVVTADHSTPCAGRMIHSGESVPFMARGEYIRRDKIDKFTEIDCAQGSLSLKGNDFMRYILNASDRGKLYHLRQGNKRRDFLIKNINRLK